MEIYFVARFKILLKIILGWAVRTPLFRWKNKTVKPTAEDGFHFNAFETVQELEGLVW